MRRFKPVLIYPALKDQKQKDTSFTTYFFVYRRVNEQELAAISDLTCQNCEQLMTQASKRLWYCTNPKCTTEGFIISETLI
ncbi:MAG: hypothetical protein ACFFC7_10525 [Candidatus Hermodarchaeota archaeon]